MHRYTGPGDGKDTHLETVTHRRSQISRRGGDTLPCQSEWATRYPANQSVRHPARPIRVDDNAAPPIRVGDTLPGQSEWVTCYRAKDVGAGSSAHPQCRPRGAACVLATESQSAASPLTPLWSFPGPKRELLA